MSTLGEDDALPKVSEAPLIIDVEFSEEEDDDNPRSLDFSEEALQHNAPCVASSKFQEGLLVGKWSVSCLVYFSKSKSHFVFLQLPTISTNKKNFYWQKYFFKSNQFRT